MFVYWYLLEWTFECVLMEIEQRCRAVNCLLFQRPHVLRQLGRLDKTAVVTVYHVRCSSVKLDESFEISDVI